MSGSIPTEYFEAAGYGQNGELLQTNKLSKVQLKNIPIKECQKSYDTVTLSSDSQMCAQSYRDDIGTQDTWYIVFFHSIILCLEPDEFILSYGDSGGSLQFMHSNYTVEGKTYMTPTIVGVTSFGIGCAYGHASVYVKVSNYLSWMESVIMP
jgi:Trypsin